MKTIELTETPAGLDTILDDAATEDIVICLGDGRRFFLASLDDFDEEILRTRNNQAFMELLKQRSISNSPTLSANEVRTKLGL